MLSIFLLNVIYAECHKYVLLAECCYAEFRYAECRGADNDRHIEEKRAHQESLSYKDFYARNLRSYQTEITQKHECCIMFFFSSKILIEIVYNFAF
jgi:hypothetical protein